MLKATGKYIPLISMTTNYKIHFRYQSLAESIRQGREGVFLSHMAPRKVFVLDSPPTTIGEQVAWLKQHVAEKAGEDLCRCFSSHTV